MKFCKVIKTTKQKEVFLASVVLTREELEAFNDDLAGDTYEVIAETHDWSVKKVSRLLDEVKDKYNMVQKENSDILKPFE